MCEKPRGVLTFPNPTSTSLDPPRPAARASCCRFWWCFSTQTICWHRRGCHRALAAVWRQHVAAQCVEALLSRPSQDHWYPQLLTAFDLQLVSQVHQQLELQGLKRCCSQSSTFPWACLCSVQLTLLGLTRAGWGLVLSYFLFLYHQLEKTERKIWRCKYIYVLTTWSFFRWPPLSPYSQPLHTIIMKYLF